MYLFGTAKVYIILPLHKRSVGCGPVDRCGTTLTSFSPKLRHSELSMFEASEECIPQQNKVQKFWFHSETKNAHRRWKSSETCIQPHVAHKLSNWVCCF